MKSKILNLIIAIFCIPVLFLCGCSNKRSELPKVEASVYIEDVAKYTTFDNSKEQSLKIDEFISPDLNPQNIKNFEKITITAKSSWIYKMYIDKIYFNFYSNKTTDTEMIVKLTITNLAKESEIGTKESVHSKELTCPFIPKENGFIECMFDIQETVAVATGCTMTIDINESINNELIEDDFRWTIYNFEIYGEHRAY